MLEVSTIARISLAKLRVIPHQVSEDADFTDKAMPCFEHYREMSETGRSGWRSTPTLLSLLSVIAVRSTLRSHFGGGILALVSERNNRGDQYADPEEPVGVFVEQAT